MAHRTDGCIFNVWRDERAELYAKFRPPYQKVVVPWLLEYCRSVQPSLADSKIPLAIDIACGSGQLTGEMAEACDKVIGIDISPAMIDAANRYNKRPNVEYRLGCAEELNKVCGDAKADIITVGMAINFFDNANFYASVRQLLKPGGVFAAFGYMAGGIAVKGRPDLEDFLLEYLKDQMVCKSFIRVLRSMECSYEDVQPPFEGEVRKHCRELFPLDRNGLRGILESNPLHVLKDKRTGIEETLKKVPCEDSFDLICDIFGVMAHS